MPDLFLKSISIGNRRNTRQYCYFLDDSLSFLLPGISMINNFRRNHRSIRCIHFCICCNDVRIHGIVCIVDTDIPGTNTMFGLLVEVDAEIQTMAGGKR